MKFGFFLTALIIGLLFALVGAFGYYVTYRTDSRACPWAYSLDKNKPLLVGKWTGKFIEPDSIEKRISVEIYEPYTTKERIFMSIGFPYSQRLRQRDAHTFDGLLTIESKLGKKQFKLKGNVSVKNMHYFDFHLLTNDNRNGRVPYFYSLLYQMVFGKQIL